MLSYALAIAVAISSLVLFSTAFLMSDIHRQDDFLWSAVGLIYALVLWFCARNITGAVLLGQASASILLVSYSWQTLKLRKALANPDRATEIGNFSVLRAVNDLLTRKKPQATMVETPSVVITNPKVTDSEIAIPNAPSPRDPSTANPQSTASKVQTEQDATKSNLSNQQPEQPQKLEKTVANTPSDDSLPESDDITTSPATPPKIQTEPESTESKIAAETKIADIKDPITDQVIPKVREEQKTAETAETTTPADQPIVLPSTTDTTAENPAPELAIAPSAEETTPTVKAEGETQKIALDNSTTADNPIPIEPQPESTTTTPTVEEVDAIKPKTKGILDSLETVEVAEVLEAVPEDVSNKNNEDKTNIIEVTTTEINTDASKPNTESNSD